MARSDEPRAPETRKLMYVFSGLPVRSGYELVAAMRANWSLATDLLRDWDDHELKDWLKSRPDGDVLLRALDLEKSGGARLIRLQAEFDPDGPLEYEGVATNEESLKAAISAADPYVSEAAPDLERFIQLKVERSELERRILRPRLPLPTGRLNGGVYQLMNEIRAIEESQIRSSQERIRSLDVEAEDLMMSPPVKAYNWLQNIRDDRILRAMAAVWEGPVAVRMLHADQRLNDWRDQSQELLQEAVFSVEYWMELVSTERRVQVDRDTDRFQRLVRLKTVAERRYFSMFSYLFAAALEVDVPTEESAKAFESAGALLRSVEAIEKLATASSKAGSLARGMVLTPRAKGENLWQAVKDLATKVQSSSPTDLGRLIPVTPILQSLTLEMNAELAELEAQLEHAAERRAKFEQEQRAIKERAAEAERKRRELVGRDLKESAELIRQLRAWRAEQLRARADALIGKAEAARGEAFSLERQVAVVRHRAAVLHRQSDQMPPSTLGVARVRRELEDAEREIGMVKVSQLTWQLDGLDRQRVQTIVDEVERIVTASRVPKERALASAESQVWQVEQRIEEVQWAHQRITRANRQLDVVSQRLDGRLPRQ